MSIKFLIAFAIISNIMSSALFALTLEQSVKEVLNNNPIVQERLKNFRATQQDLTIAESEYYPSFDFRATAGYNDAGTLNKDITERSYSNYESSLTLTQNIFDGFGTTNKVDYQEARILASAYNYIEKSNDTAFKMTSAYINVLQSNELLQTAKENVNINQTIFNKVKDLYESGLTTDSEVKKIQSALSLAKSNLTVQKNNALDTEYNFRRVLGRMPELPSMKRPNFNFSMPVSIERAAMYAIKNNPSLLVSRYNIKGAQSLYKQKIKEFYPKIDLEIAQNYNDNDTPTNGFNQPDDRFSARIVLNYNIFRGGADSAEVQKNISKINQEIEIKRDLKRQVIEGLDLSWNAYKMIGLQLKDLREYSVFSEKTLELYKEEYDLGRRSLLDLLSAQNDVINSRSQIITAEYEQLFAKYRILDAMGLLVVSLIGDVAEYTAKVNINSDDEAYEVLDTIPVELDVDHDNISDNLDLCDNSLLENNIMPYGCKKTPKDSDGDGVFDSVDTCLLTPPNVKVALNGCALDSDKDGVKDYKDECLNTPYGHKVDANGCSVSVNLTVNFPDASSYIPSKAYGAIDEFANFLKDNKNFKVLVVGHTNSIGDAEYNLWLSKRRAKSIRTRLISIGIDADRITSDGKGESEPLLDDETEEALEINRRVEIQLSKINEEEF